MRTARNGVCAALLAAALVSVAACAPPPRGAPDAARLFEPPRAPPRLALSNFSTDHARIVVAVVAAGAQCAMRGPGVIATSSLPVPFNGTQIVYAPPGADVCWYRDLAADQQVGDAELLRSFWNRAYLSQGRSIDTQI